MATPALALCIKVTLPTIGPGVEMISITIVTVAIVGMEVVTLEHVGVILPGRGLLLFV